MGVGAAWGSDSAWGRGRTGAGWLGVGLGVEVGDVGSDDGRTELALVPRCAGLGVGTVLGLGPRVASWVWAAERLGLGVGLGWGWDSGSGSGWE